MLGMLIGIKGRLTWSLIGNLVFAFSQWVILFILARFGTTTVLGIYSLGLAVTAPFIQFFSFDLRTVLATDSKKDYDFQQYFGSRIIHLFIAYVLIIPVSLFYSENAVTTFSILIIGLVKYFEALSDLCMGFFQRESRIDLIGKSQFYRGLMTILVSAIVFLVTQSVNLMLTGILIVMILRFFLYDIKNLIHYTRVFPIFDFSSLKMIALFYPLGITALISSLIPNIPRYLLDHYFGVEAVGIFSALYYVLVAGNMLITPLSLLAAPRIAKSYHDGVKNNFLILNIRLIALSTVISLILILPIFINGEYILLVLYGKSFVEFSNAFIIVSITLLFGFINSFLNLSIVATREIRALPIVNLIAVCVSIITGLFLIKHLGIEGAAWALLSSRFAQTFLYSILFVLILRKGNWNKLKEGNE